MRTVTSIETPSLFAGLHQTGSETEEKTSDRITRDFVQWCWSFGKDFRNSPDITNFRFWQHKSSTKSSAAEEDEILAEARRLFLKRLEQAVRKADAVKEPD